MRARELYAEGMSRRDVAEAVGVSVATVESYLVGAGRDDRHKVAAWRARAAQLDALGWPLARIGEAVDRSPHTVRMLLRTQDRATYDASRQALAARRRAHILALRLAGHPPKAIAAGLGVSWGTVNVHIRALRTAGKLA